MEGTPVMPEWLDDDAITLWNAVVPDLATAGVAKAADSHMLAAMCDAWSMYLAARVIAHEHPNDKDSRLNYVAYYNAFSSVASRFGLTPSDRARLNIKPANEGEPKVKSRNRK